MATEAVVPQPFVMADYKGRVDPDWCPGCGHYGVLAAVQKALVELQIPNDQVATVSGIGCSSNFPGFIETYGLHSLHGRSLPVATGVKMANHGLTVLVTGGDGDGFGIGCGHFVHTMRRNIDLTYLVLDNQKEVVEIDLNKVGDQVKSLQGGSSPTGKPAASSSAAARSAASPWTSA